MQQVQSQINWKKRFLSLAEHISQWSKDHSTKVGAVIADKHNRIVSLGFNGFPRGIQDDLRLNDRSLKYQIVVHAEMNAMHFAGQGLDGCTLYTWPLPPCSRCASSIIQVGITHVYSIYPNAEINKRWEDDIQLAAQMMEETGIVLDLIRPSERVD